MKNLFVSKPKYHEPVKQIENRFYLIKIDYIQKISQRIKIKDKNQFQQKNKKKQPSSKQNKKKQNTKSKTKQNELIKFKISFQIGRRSAQTGFIVQLQQQNIDNKNQKGKKIKNKNKQPVKQIPSNIKNHNTENAIGSDYKFQDIHIFPFEKQQVMSIKFQNLQNSKQYGYALVPLVPFIKIPHTKHQIQVDMVFQTQFKQIKNQIAVVLHLNLYFLHNFKAKLFVQPVQADLSRNLAQIGQMNPIISFFLRQTSTQTDSVDQGGIKPHWQSKRQNQFCYFNFPLESVFDDLYVYMHYQRQITMDQMIGKAKIDLQQEGIFKNGLTVSQFIKLGQQYMEYRQKLQQFGSDKLNRGEQNRRNQKQDSKKMTKDQEIRKSRQEVINKYKESEESQIKKRTGQWSSKIIYHILTDCTTINSKNPPKILQEITNKIYQQFDQNYKMRLVQLQQTKQFVKVKQFYTNQQIIALIYESELGQQQYKTAIYKYLKTELQNFTTFVQQKMQQTQIAIYYQPVNQRGQVQKQKVVGTLVLRYLFVYEFQYDE